MRQIKLSVIGIFVSVTAMFYFAQSRSVASAARKNAGLPVRTNWAGLELFGPFRRSAASVKPAGLPSVTKSSAPSARRFIVTNFPGSEAESA